ncbi:MAG TPA: hypothetical protein VH370_01715 [Humisphaera sp.]|jgi:hypothetical protein|nr:hypothetical protein [Humisphaera sp.]
MLPIYSVQFILLLACAGTFYKVAKRERKSGIIWFGLSSAVFVLTWMVFHWSYVGNLSAQSLMVGVYALARNKLP